VFLGGVGLNFSTIFTSDFMNERLALHPPLSTRISLLAPSFN